MVNGRGSRNLLPDFLYISGMKGGTLVVIFFYLSTGVIDPKILGVGV
jgi:hypothetical protein